MIKERADELVAALRSGKYRQSQGALRQDDTYCCLGVACDVSGLGKWLNDSPIKYTYLTDMGGDSNNLPTEVKDYFGFHDECGAFKAASFQDMVGVPKDALTLIDLNDDKRWTFDQIADFVEDNWDRL